MASTTSPEAKELSLVDKVELKIALTDTDAKLQTVLGTYLPPLLLKLASEHLSVRNKVISICQHINTRIKPQDIQLPVTALLKQFKDHAKNQLVCHFDLIYVQQGFSRLPSSERIALLPLLASGLSDLSSRSAAHASIVFNLLLRSLVEYNLPPKGSPEDLNLRATLTISDEDAGFIALWIGRLVLFRASSSAQAGSVLSIEEQQFLTVQGKQEVWDPSSPSGLNLAQAKIVALKLMNSGAFNDDERLLPGIFASADANSRISDMGETLLKSAIPNVDTNSSPLIERLYDLYDSALTMAPLRIRILGLLSKNSSSTKFPRRIIQIADRGLLEQTTRSDREATKLQAAIVQLLTFTAKNADAVDLKTVSKDVVSRLKDFLEQQFSDQQSPEIKVLRGRCFEVIGLLASANPDLVVETELTLLRWLFRSLAEEKDKDVVFSIDEAISGTIRPFQKSYSTELKQDLKNLLVDVLQLDSLNQRNTRFACIRFANRCLPFRDVTARWIDISVLGAASAESHELVEEAKKGLDPYWHRLSSAQSSSPDNDQTRSEDLRPPAFAEMVHHIFKKQFIAATDKSMLLTALSFCRKCLYWSCMTSTHGRIDDSADWERKMDTALVQDQATRTVIRKAIGTTMNDHENKTALLTLISQALKCLQGDVKSRSEFANIAFQVASLSPDSLVASMSSSYTQVEAALLGNDMESRRLAAQIFGILATHPSVEEHTLKDVIDGLFQKLQDRTTAVGRQLNQAHGALLGLAHFVSRRVYRGDNNEMCQAVTTQLMPQIVDIIRKSSDLMLQGAGYQALGQLCLFSVIDVETLTSHMDLLSLIEELAKASQSGNEKAVAALGNLSIILDEDKHEKELEELLAKVRSLHELRQPESQFAVGETLSCIGYGWNSKALLANIDIEGQAPLSKPRTMVPHKLLETILDDCKTSKPAMKKASVIWLLCLLQFCDEQEEVQQRLPQFQAAFKRCLSDRDDLVQESASRGLGLVYEKGSRELKDDLVRDLVGSFSSNKADISGTVTEETQLFEPGALPTGEGSITTYKDIMSLAAEVGDSSLVYRFMSLASNNAIWSSRAAFGRFGLSNVLSDSSVDGYLANNPKLYPKLYRYRFDPNGNVRRSMNDIWNALVKDTAATIDTHFDAILNDLLVNMVGREWRARQASCAAVADLVQGQKLTRLQPHLSQVWTLTYKVLDDIKESVRTAAAELARVLSNLLVRNLESSEGKGQVIEELLETVLPFLLSTSGLESSAKEVQAFSLHTLLEIIKKSKHKNLLPFVPELVQQLLGLLSTFEHEAVNYMALNASNYKIQQSDIDDYRLKSIRSSPLMEAIERCLDMLDNKAMQQLSSGLVDAMKTAVGVPSKVGISRVLVSLSTRRNFVFRPFADQQLIGLRKRVMDRNETVSSSYAASIGYVARLATDDQLLKTVGFARRLYFGDEESDRPRYVAGEIIQGIARHASDRFNALASDILPFVFFGRYDDEKRVQEVFEETYNDTASGPRAATLYLNEITTLAKENLGSKRWTFKHAAALAVCEAVKAVASSNGKIGKEQGRILWPALQTALAEKSWEGKEKVLDGLVVFVEKGQEFCHSQEGFNQELRKISLREGRRQNKSYQPAALAALGKIAKLLTETDMFDDVYGIAQPLLEESQESMLVDDSKEGDGEAHKESLVKSSIEAVFGSVEGQLQVESENGQDLRFRVTRLVECIQLAIRANVANHTGIHATVFTQIRAFLQSTLQHLPAPRLAQILLGGSIRPTDHTHLGLPSPFSIALAEILTTQDPPLQAPLQEKPRMLRAEALQAYAQTLNKANVSDDNSKSEPRSPFPENLLASLASLIGAEKAPQIRTLLHNVQQTLKTPERSV